MQRKKLIFSLVCVAIISSIISSLIFVYKNSEVQQGKTNFSKFLREKKEILTKAQSGIVNNFTEEKSLYSWNKNESYFEKVSTDFLQEFEKNKNEVVSTDLNNNLIKEIYKLEQGRLAITENSKLVWQSESDWWVDYFYVSDSNNDGIIDLNLSVWKAGDFGSSKPFWIKRNDMSVKNHFFVFDFVKGKISAIWQSSNLEVPNCEFIFDDINSDGKNELVVIEGDYLDNPKCEGKYVAVWKWNGWGFSNEWRSERGLFYNLQVDIWDGIKCIIVQNKSH